MDRETVINRMETICNICKENTWRTEFSSDTIYPLLRDAIVLLKDQEAAEPIMAGEEGCGCTWWYVCPKCKLSVDYKDAYCRHCGREFAWGELKNEER